MYKMLSFIIAEYCATTESSYVKSVSSEFIAPHEYLSANTLQFI